MDAAFKTGAYPAYTLAELEIAVTEGRGTPTMVAEIQRRQRVLAGDMTVATDGERLRAAKRG